MMRTSSRLLPLLIAMFAVAGPLQAQQADEGTRTITFSEALEIALEQNSSLRMAVNATEVSAVAVRGERMQFLPDLRVSTRGAQNYGRYFDQSEGQIFNEAT